MLHCIIWHASLFFSAVHVISHVITVPATAILTMLYLYSHYPAYTRPSLMFSVHKLIPKIDQMTTLYTNWSLYITFTIIYYIRQN